MKSKQFIVALALIFAFAISCSAGEVATELKKAIGYVVLDVYKLSNVDKSNDGTHLVTLTSGAILSIRPLVFTPPPIGSDVAILVRPNAKEPLKSEFVALIGDTIHPAVILNPVNQPK